MLDTAQCLVVKKLIVSAGKRISFQRHRHRSERWIALEGVATVQRDGELLQLHPGEGALIPRGCPHRLSNETDQEIVVLEVQFGDLLSEDDIERMDDDFGRVI